MTRKEEGTEGGIGRRTRKRKRRGGRGVEKGKERRGGNKEKAREFS